MYFSLSPVLNRAGKLLQRYILPLHPDPSVCIALHHNAPLYRHLKAVTGAPLHQCVWQIYHSVVKRYCIQIRPRALFASAHQAAAAQPALPAFMTDSLFRKMQ